MNIIEIKIVDFENGGYAASCTFDKCVFGSFEKADSLAGAEKNLRRNMYCQIYNASRAGLCRKWDRASDKFVFARMKWGRDMPQGLFAPAPMPQAKRLYELVEIWDENRILHCSIKKHEQELLTESEIKAKIFPGDK